MNPFQTARLSCEKEKCCLYKRSGVTGRRKDGNISEDKGHLEASRTDSRQRSSPDVSPGRLSAGEAETAVSRAAEDRTASMLAFAVSLNQSGRFILFLKHQLMATRQIQPLCFPRMKISPKVVISLTHWINSHISYSAQSVKITSKTDRGKHKSQS